MEKRDVVIIGGGPAGYAAAIRLAQLGRKACLVEKEALGGTCLNRGCIPTMVLAKAVEILETAKSGKDFGIAFPETAVDFGKLAARKGTIVKTLVGGIRSLLEAHRIEILEGKARFLSPREIEVVSSDGRAVRLAPDKVIVATGSAPARENLQGDGEGFIETQQLLGRLPPPPSAVILNGGLVGLTLASIFSRLGTRVTVIEEEGGFLSGFDGEIVDILQKELKKQKVNIIAGGRIAGIVREEGEIALEVETKAAKDVVRAALVVNGRRQACVEGLGLSAVGVELNGLGGIATSGAMETSVKSIFAAGDVTGDHLWTPAAYMEGIVAAENVAGIGSVVDYGGLPCWAHTSPPVCGAGMTEEEARAKGYEVQIGRFPLAANGMATILGRRTGMAKVISEGRYGQILGVQVIGFQATEIVQEVLLAMKGELTSREIGAVFHVHPSLIEAAWEAARALNGESIHSI